MKLHKSLRDTMLEFAVFNFSEVFRKFQDPSTVGDTILPPLLFEDVISKSKEIPWLIKTTDLESCFPCRDVLRWENIEVTLCNDNVKALESMVNLKHPIRNLSLQMRIVDDGIIERITALGSTLVTLELSCLMWHAMVFSNENFPKLNKLVVKRERRNDLHFLPFLLQVCHNPDTLKEVIIDNQAISIELVNSLKYLTNLKTLSLSYCAFKTTECQAIMKELGSLTTLRTLNLCHMNLKFDDQILYETLKKLTNLENLDLSDSSCNEKDLELIIKSPPKKWKKLGLFHLSDSLYPFKATINSLADQVFGVFPGYESELFLSSVEYYTNNHVLKSAYLAKRLARYIHLVPLEKTPRVEKVLLEAFTIYHEEKKKMGSRMCIYLENERCTQEFTLKIAYILSSYRANARNNELIKGKRKPEFGPEWMLGLDEIMLAIYEFVRKDLNRTVAKNLLFELKCVFIDQPTFEPAESLLKLFEDSIENNLYNEEIRNVMEDILELVKSRTSID